MNKENIIDYVVHTPHNTNKKVLDGMLETLMDDNILQSDWNQNDESAKDYIKNRPFYISDPVETAIVEETTFELVDDIGQITATQPLEVGQEYVITLNGTSYNCVAKFNEEFGMPYIGNLGGVYGENTGEPFLISPSPDSDTELELEFVFASDVLEYTVSVVKIVTEINQIDPKYIPDSVKTHDWNTLENRPFGEEIEYITYIEEQTAEFIESGNGVSVSIPEVQMPDDWVQYIVAFNGIEYVATMTDNGDTAWIPVILNDGATMKIFSNGYIYINSKDYIGQHTIKVGRKINVVHTIENKYLGIPVYNGTGIDSICINSNNNIASGNYSKANGLNTIASGNYSKANGLNTIASGNYSHAEGEGTIAKGINEYVSGSYNISFNYVDDQGTYGTTIKIADTTNNTYASDNYIFNYDTGMYTLISGYKIDAPNETNTKGRYIIYNGTSDNTMYYATNGIYPSQGSYYIKEGGIIHFAVSPSETRKYLSIVGNGIGDTKRSNAHTLDYDGNAWFSGDVYTGSTSGTNRDEGSKKLATEEYVNTKFTDGVESVVLLSPNGTKFNITVGDDGVLSASEIK